MLDERFVILGSLIALGGGMLYLIETLQGKLKPNRVSFLLWSVVPLIAFIAEIEKGVGLQSLLTFMAGFNPLLILLASFTNKNAYWKLQRLDYVFGGIATGGVALWLLTGEGNLAIAFAILADGLAAIPTFVKTYKAPQTENPITYLTITINAALTLMTIRIWDFAHYAFPLYVLIMGGILFFMIKLRLRSQVQLTQYLR